MSHFQRKLGSLGQIYCRVEASFRFTDENDVYIRGKLDAPVELLLEETL